MNFFGHFNLRICKQCYTFTVTGCANAKGAVASSITTCTAPTMTDIQAHTSKRATLCSTTRRQPRGFERKKKLHKTLNINCRDRYKVEKYVIFLTSKLFCQIHAFCHVCFSVHKNAVDPWTPCDRLKTSRSCVGKVLKQYSSPRHATPQPRQRIVDVDLSCGHWFSQVGRVLLPPLLSIAPHQSS